MHAPHQGEFVESGEVTGTTDINPISKIPPPDPVTASAFYQKGEDYIQVVWSKISKNFLLLRQQLVAGEMGSTCRDDPLHQWVPGPILVSLHLILAPGCLEREPGGHRGGGGVQHCGYRPTRYFQVGLIGHQNVTTRGHLVVINVLLIFSNDNLA